ncbi:MAG: hypothetical protein AAF525_03520 [Pseudomonadota bacterium]
MIPPVLLLISIQSEKRRIPIPIPLILAWPILLVGFLAVGTRFNAMCRIAAATRGLRISIQSRNKDNVLIWVL